MVGNTIKALASFKAIGRGGNWNTFKTVVLIKFKGKDEDQLKYTEGYLQQTALGMRNKEGTIEDYHAFIEDFCEKADKLMEKNIFNEYRRVRLFRWQLARERKGEGRSFCCRHGWVRKRSRVWDRGGIRHGRGPS